MLKQLDQAIMIEFALPDKRKTIRLNQCNRFNK